MLQFFSPHVLIDTELCINVFVKRNQIKKQKWHIDKVTEINFKELVLRHH